MTRESPHHWDSMMLFDEATKSAFPSDLFIQPGDHPPPVVMEDLGSEMCGYYREIGIFAHEDPVRHVVDRIARFDPDWIHGCTAGASRGRRSPASCTRCARNRSPSKGKVLGRELPTET